MWVSCKNHVDDLWRLSSPIPNQSRTSQSRLLRNFFSEVLTMTCLHISFTDFTSGPNFLRSNFSVAFCPTPAHLWGAWFCLLFGPLLGSCRQQRLFPLPSLLKLNNPSCFSISSYVMCSSPVHLGGSPPRLMQQGGVLLELCVSQVLAGGEELPPWPAGNAPAPPPRIWSAFSAEKRAVVEW